jgi:hypothetical protein
MIRALVQGRVHRMLLLLHCEEITVKVPSNFTCLCAKKIKIKILFEKSWTEKHQDLQNFVVTEFSDDLR